MKLKLYYAPRTRAARVRWLLEELDLTYDLKNIKLFEGEGETDEYKKIHPLGCVPALEVDGEIIYESGAICDWLTDRFADKNMAPPLNSTLRLKYKQWFYFVVATMEPEAWNMVLHLELLPENKRLPDVVDASKIKYKQALGVIEKELKEKEYLLGDKFTTADIMLVTLLSWFPQLVKPFENTYAYMKKMRKRENCIL